MVKNVETMVFLGRVLMPCGTGPIAPRHGTATPLQTNLPNRIDRGGGTPPCWPRSGRPCPQEPVSHSNGILLNDCATS